MLHRNTQNRTTIYKVSRLNLDALYVFVMKKGARPGNFQSSEQEIKFRQLKIPLGYVKRRQMGCQVKQC